MLLAQFTERWSRPTAVPPEHELALAVLCQAMNDLVRYRFSRSRANQRLSLEAYEWERPKTARGRSAS